MAENLETVVGEVRGAERVREIVRENSGKGFLFRNSRTNRYHFGILNFNHAGDQQGFFNTIIPPENFIERHNYGDILEMYPILKSSQLL